MKRNTDSKWVARVCLYFHLGTGRGRRLRLPFRFPYSPASAAEEMLTPAAKAVIHLLSQSAGLKTCPAHSCRLQNVTTTLLILSTALPRNPLPIGTAVHERTFELCKSLNYREWSGFYTV